MLTVPPPAPPGQKPVAAPVSYAPDFRNSLATPSGPEHQLLLGEGQYATRDEITLGAVPAHPHYQPAVSSNVLDTKPLPPTAPPILSTTARAPTTHDVDFDDAFQFPAAGDKASAGLPPPGSKGASSSRLKYLATGNIKAYVAGDAAPHGPSQPAPKETKEPAKRRKPKNNIVKSNSSLVSRATPHDNLSKRLNERNPDDPFGFVNNSRSFLWLDLGSAQKADQLMKIMFTKGNPLCHDVNATTKTVAPKQYAHVDVIVGFSTSDIMWFEPMSQKYSRLNKRGAINDYPVSSIQWIPGSENLFIAAHFDGSLVVYDKDRDDAVFVADEEGSGGSALPPPAPAPPQPAAETAAAKRSLTFDVVKSQRSKTQKTNPVAVYKIAKRKVNAIECSPDGRFVAAACEDGSLRIIDLMKEELTDVYWSYYGGFTCVCWSPDGKLLLSGGQDDLVSLWSFEERSIVARCMGHRSWVSSVAFDAWRCDGVNYRFGSVGEDCRLLLWDYSGAVVHGQGNASIRPSVSSTAGNGADMAQRNQSSPKLDNVTPRDSQESLAEEDSIIHAAEARAAVATLPPVFAKVVSDSPMSWIGFQEKTMMTASASGHIWTYDRPPREGGGAAPNGQAFKA